MIRRILALAIAVVGAGCGHSPDPTRVEPAPGTAPTRIVLVVADGAGTAYWSVGRMRAGSLAVEEFPVVGLMDPSNVSQLEPESASSATAIAIGERTFAAAVGVGPDSAPRTTLLERAEELGWGTGLVTTTSLTDATPASFAAHVPDRGMHRRIARQLSRAPVEVMLGDGRRYFEGEGGSGSGGPLERVRAGRRLVESAAELEDAVDDPPERLVGFFDIDAIEDPELREPSLAAMTRAALSVLDRYPGSFLVVESEHTDHRGHDNAPLETIAAEVLHFDEAVREILAYRTRHPETLVVVLGDHETGGLSIVSRNGAPTAGWTTTAHTLEMVPVFAVGPGAERFSGVLGNDEIGRRLRALVEANH
ncbi:MAG: alkaline phosphatase [Gemmatimonadota bacterium]|nr:alkaline phosphatase [Gemmatimonadota bacterium]